MMYSLELEGVRCGMIGRTIGGPYATLIAERLHAAATARVSNATGNSGAP
jgi:hypothetical protein